MRSFLPYTNVMNLQLFIYRCLIVMETRQYCIVYFASGTSCTTDTSSLVAHHYLQHDTIDSTQKWCLPYITWQQGCCCSVMPLIMAVD